MSTRSQIVLVAEDEATDRLLIQQAFAACQPALVVHSVENGAEAIAYLMGEGKYSDRARFPYPSFILTDLKMPHMDGFHVLEHLKNNPSWAVIPIVVLSASDDPDDVRTSYALGASSHIVKPNDFPELKARIKALRDYWIHCSIPSVDDAGQQIRTESKGKLGERYPQCAQLPQRRVKRKRL